MSERQRFEWDERKRRANFAKHHVDFSLAREVFNDPFLQTEEDELVHGEIRYRSMGMARGRLLFVVYTEHENIIRLISARKATSHERRRYENRPR